MSFRAAFLSIIFLASFSTVHAVAETKVLTIEESLSIALEKNPKIVAARARVDQATGRKVQARGRFMPSVDADANLTYRNDSLIQSFNTQRFGANRGWDAQIGLSQTLFAGGKIVAGFKQQKYTENAALFQLAATINDQLFIVKRLFLAALLARDQLKVQEENIKLLEEELRLERARYSAGTVSKFNVLRAEVALANGKVPLIRAENATRVTLIELEKAIGIFNEDTVGDDKSDINVTGKVVFEPVVYNFDSALKVAYDNRPEIKSMDLMVKASQEGVKVAWSDFLPTLRAGVNYRGQSNQFSDDYSDNFHGWTAGGNMHWNLFNGFETSGKVDETRAQKRETIAQLNDSRASVRVEVKRAISNIDEAKALYAASKKVVEQAVESLRLARARFDAGSSSQLDVLDSQVALTDARTNEVQALYDYENARTDLKRSLGTDLSIVTE